MITELYIHLSVGILLGSVTQTIRDFRGAHRLGWLPLLTATSAIIPIMGLSLARWVYSFTGPISVPLTLILGWYVLKPSISTNAINKRSLLIFWSLTVGLSVSYFPQAIGWTSFDPHGFGWNKQFVCIPIVLAIVSIWMGQGGLTVAFLASAIAWKAGLLESSNGWNYLIDPIAFLVCAFSLSSFLIKAVAHSSRGKSLELDLEPAKVVEQHSQSIAA